MSFPWGTKPRGQKEDLHPLASAATSTPPQLPLGDKTPRNNPLASAATLAAPASLGRQNPEDNKEKTKTKEQHRPEIEPATAAVMERRGNRLNNPAFKQNSKNYLQRRGYKQDTAQTSRVRLKRTKQQGSWTQIGPWSSRIEVISESSNGSRIDRANT